MESQKVGTKKAFNMPIVINSMKCYDGSARDENCYDCKAPCMYFIQYKKSMEEGLDSRD